MRFENTEVMNFQGAFRGLRNPLESWDKSDSAFGLDNIDGEWDYQIASKWVETIDILDFEQDYDNYQEKKEQYVDWLCKNGILRYDDYLGVLEYAFIGPKDMDLAQRMIKAGTSDSKFLRQIFVSVDITAPLYWWKEADTYKIATVANSTSTMHKLASTPITLDCFETDDFQNDLDFEPGGSWYKTKDFVTDIIQSLEYLRLKYLETKDKKYWKELIRWLPESWLQTRTYTCNYAVLRNIVHQRKYHRLKYEWDSFIKWCQTLPYANELIFYNNGYENGYKLHDLLSQK